MFEFGKYRGEWCVVTTLQEPGDTAPEPGTVVDVRKRDGALVKVKVLEVVHKRHVRGWDPNDWLIYSRFENP